MSGFYSHTRPCELQNAKRRAKQVSRFARLNHPSYGPKKPEICLSPNGLRRNVTVPAAKPCFRAAVPIWEGNRGDSRGVPPNLHTFLCITWWAPGIEIPTMAGLLSRPPVLLCRDPRASQVLARGWI